MAEVYIKRLSLIVLVSLSSFLWAEEAPTNPGNNVGNKPIPRMDKPKTRLYEQAGLGFYDGSFEATGKIQADKFYEFVHISTPSTPAANHAREWFNNDTQRLCVRFDDGSSACLGPGSAGGGALSFVGDPLSYDAVSNSLTLGKIGVDSGTVGGFPTSRLTGLTTNYIQNRNSLQSGATFYVSSGTVLGSMYASSYGLTDVPGTIQQINGNIGIFGNSGDIYIDPQDNGRVSLTQGSTLTWVAGDGLAYQGFRSSDSIANSIVWTLPRSKGLNKQRLATDNANNLYFIDPSDGLTVSLSTGVTGVIGISTQTNLAATHPILLTSNVLSLGKVSLSTGVTGTLPDGNITNTFTSSKTFTSSSGSYFTYNVSAGSITARNIASGTQCVQADSSGNLSGTGTTCASGTGDAVLSSTQTWTGGNTFLSSITVRNTLFDMTNSSVTITSGTLPSFMIVGVTTNTDAPTGRFGEFISSTTNDTTYPCASGTACDIVQITLSPGDWDVTINAGMERTGVQSLSDLITWASTKSGNDSSELTVGNNGGRLNYTLWGTSWGELTVTVPLKRYLIGANTTVYLKMQATYSSTAPLCTAVISARRVR